VISFENREHAADLKQSQSDARHSLFADSIPQSPFSAMAKQEAKPAMLAWNDSTTSDVGIAPLEISGSVQSDGPRNENRAQNTVESGRTIDNRASVENNFGGENHAEINASSQNKRAIANYFLEEYKR